MAKNDILNADIIVNNNDGDIILSTNVPVSVMLTRDNISGKYYYDCYVKLHFSTTEEILQNGEE